MAQAITLTDRSPLKDEDFATLPTDLQRTVLEYVDDPDYLQLMRDPDYAEPELTVEAEKFVLDLFNRMHYPQNVGFRRALKELRITLPAEEIRNQGMDVVFRRNMRFLREFFYKIREYFSPIRAGLSYNIMRSVNRQALRSACIKMKSLLKDLINEGKFENLSIEEVDRASYVELRNIISNLLSQENIAYILKIITHRGWAIYKEGLECLLFFLPFPKISDQEITNSVINASRHKNCLQLLPLERADIGWMAYACGKAAQGGYLDCVRLFPLHRFSDTQIGDICIYAARGHSANVMRYLPLHRVSRERLGKACRSIVAYDHPDPIGTLEALPMDRILGQDIAKAFIFAAWSNYLENAEALPIHRVSDEDLIVGFEELIERFRRSNTCCYPPVKVTFTTILFRNKLLFSTLLGLTLRTIIKKKLPSEISEFLRVRNGVQSKELLQLFIMSSAMLLAIYFAYHNED